MTTPMGERVFDWQEARRRLERARRSLESGGERTAEESLRILEERARALARPPEEPEAAPAEIVEVLVFAIGDERYGIDTSSVLEATPLRGLVPVPGTPPFLAGVMLHRGRVVPVLELRALLGLPGEGTKQGAYAVVLEVAGMTFGIEADGVIEVRGIPAPDLDRPSPAQAGRASLVRAVTSAAAILDVEALVRDPRIVVDDRAR